jgi:hypothetical protein
MVVFTEKIKKIFIIFLVISVSFLVIYALYTNKDRFYSRKAVKYSLITIDENNDIDKIIASYEGMDDRNNIVSQIKKINRLSSLSNETVYGKTIYVPMYESN